MIKRSMSWRVEWKCSHHPNEWKPFSTFKEYPSEAMGSYEECLKRPGCIAARIVEREVITEERREIIPPEQLQGRI